MLISLLLFLSPPDSLPPVSHWLHSLSIAALPVRPALVTPFGAWPRVYAQPLPPTCAAEKKLQKALRLPLFIRAGNLETVNRLEGKP